MQTKISCPNCKSLIPLMARAAEHRAENALIGELSLELYAESNDDLARFNRIFPVGVDYTLSVVRTGNRVTLKPVLKSGPEKKELDFGETADQRRERAIMLNIPGASGMTDLQIAEALKTRAEAIGKGKRGIEASKLAGAVK